MSQNIQQAINFLEAHGFNVRGYGYPEHDFGGDHLAENYRVLQGDFDTGMIAPQQLVNMADQIRETH
ncbi:MAG: hypothetical protein ACXVP2_09625 [Tumebacillaceae bacterium]